MYFGIKAMKHMSLLSILLCTTLLACSPSGEVESDKTPSEIATSAPSKAETSKARTEISSLVQKADIPNWVELQALPEFPEESLDLIKNGVAYITKEDRYHVTDTGYKYFYRLAYKVTDRKGLESAAQIQRTFDPELGSLTYNFVKVIRDGKTTDRLPDLSIQELQREDGLSDGLVDGDITSLIHLEDIRVGDIIEYGYSSEYLSPLWPGHFFNNVSISYGVPLASQIYEISVPEDTTLNLDVINSKVRPKISRANQRTTYKYEIKNAAVDKKVSNVPVGVITDPYLLMSTMQSWQEVSEWGVGVYDVDLTLPKDYNSTIRSLKMSAKTAEGRMVAALKQVQNDIRYLGIESGINSHKPRIPNVTLSKGYGDCKDKAVLLIATLRKLGISAHPALVSIDSGKILPQLLPSINNFDHVIVMAEIDGKSYWLDPTLTYQAGSEDTLTVPDYGYVLPLKTGQSNIVEIVITPPSNPTTHVTETYRLEEDGSMSLKADTVYRGASADSMRRSIIKSGLEATSNTYLNYYADFYPGLSLQDKMITSDDQELNLFSIHESYYLSADDFETNEINDKLYIKAATLENQIPASIEADREVKLGLNKNTFLQHTMIIETPGKQFMAPDSLTVETAGITFSREYSSKNEALTIDYILKIDESSVPLTSARDVTELADKVAEEIQRNVYPKAATQKLSKRIGLNGEVPENIDAELTVINGLLMKKENVEVLERLNKLEADYTKNDPLRGYIQYLRGAVLIDLKRKKAAITAFDEAFSLFDPDKSDIYFSYVSLLYEDEQNLKAVDIIERLFSVHPEAIKKVNYKWLWNLYGEVFRAEEVAAYEDVMIATAKAQLEYVDDIDETDRAFEIVIPILVRKGEIETAKPFLQYLKNPSNIRDILIDKELEKIWPHVSKIAGSDLSLAIENYIQHTAEPALKDDADFKTKSQYLYALYQGGRLEEAKAFGEKALENWSRIDAVGMDAYWHVAGYASIFSGLGQSEKADEILEALLKDRLKDNPELIGIAINRVDLLVWNGHFQKAIKLVESYEADEDFQTNDYGWVSLHQSRACAMFEEGEKKKALEYYAEKTKDISSENLPAHFLAMVCMDEFDEAATVLKERLESELHRETTLPVFSTMNDRKNPNPYQVKFMKKIKAVAARPDVMEVFEKYGRSIYINGPSEYWEEY
ncbi:MAG: DUF3857 domain-containing protein [Hellea sp.]